jgi:hypothetical protein
MKGLQSPAEAQYLASDLLYFSTIVLIQDMKNGHEPPRWLAFRGEAWQHRSGVPTMMMLMCSERREEVAAVKSELFKAGIRSQIRENPVTAALRIRRVELWVEKERDHLAARKVYSGIQARGGNGHEPTVAEDSTEISIEMDGPPGLPEGAAGGRVADLDTQNPSQRPGGELEEASVLLEKEIEELLKRDDALAENCVTLRREVENLTRSLSESQAAAEKKAAESATLRNSLEGELAERRRSEEQLKGEVGELQSRLKSGEETLSEKQRSLETALQQLQTQQATVAQLRKGIVLREQESDANRRLMSKAQAELAVEKESRMAAEEKAARSAQAQERLEAQLVEQKNLEAQLRASIGSMNSLRGRLQAKRNSILV